MYISGNFFLCQCVKNNWRGDSLNHRGRSGGGEEDIGGDGGWGGAKYKMRANG